uniref:Uncharacterized protein n=1 Tax=Podoviridae sp. ctz6O13 TaxID=2827757 RepID=A0A8S5TK65_9CAUD|nr:MAG TPA: hypothetical protein [Podoviridae sp. ctz6O13]
MPIIGYCNLGFSKHPGINELGVVFPFIGKGFNRSLSVFSCEVNCL